MTTENNQRMDGSVNTRLAAQGQDVHIGQSPLLFYAVGRDKLIAVPGESANQFMEEMRYLDMVVEDHLDAIAELSAHHSNYEALTTTVGNDPAAANDRDQIEQQIKTAQQNVESRNRELKKVTDTLTDLTSQNNKIMELIPIQRQGTRSEYFRMGYVRSHFIDPISEEIPLIPSSSQGNPGENIITNGQVDWEKLRQQMSNARGEAKIKADFPWFDEWLQLDKTSTDLFKWSEEINRNLELKHETVFGEDGDKKVELSAEAQLMRWTYGASGLTGELNPFEGKVTIKTDGKAELVLAEAKGTIGYYTPSGGLMLACELPNGAGTVDLGMIRAYAFLTVAGGVGASIAAELGVNVELSGGKFIANGTEGGLVEYGLPGEQRAIIPAVQANGSVIETKNNLGAFAGGQAEVTIGGQLEWKNPEEGHKYKPFAKAAPGAAALVGLGGEVDFWIHYDEGKFKLSVKAGLCLGFGAKGKLDFEVDSNLIMEFIKWVAHQLKNINYGKLLFIETEAFNAISNIIVLAIAKGIEVKNIMLESAGLIVDSVIMFFQAIPKNMTSAEMRGRLAERVNENSEFMKYSTPEAKGFIVYQLTQINVFDKYHPSNRDMEGWFENPNIFGSMTDRKEAIMNIFRHVQSKAEYHNVMQCVTQRVGEKIDARDGENIVLEFMALGENEEWFLWLSTHYPNDLRRLFENLKDVASIGTEIIPNSDKAYAMQVHIAPEFSMPCMNRTECIFSGRSMYV